MRPLQLAASVVVCVCWCCSANVLSQDKSVFIEELTWAEVRDGVGAGQTTAIYFAGSVEQNGVHLALGKHNFISRYLAEKIARELGNALVYPIMPFAPAGDPAAKTGHMAYAGSVSVSEETFANVAHDVILSAKAAGFKNIVLMGDHGGGQDVLDSVARSFASEWTANGVHVYYIPDVYYKAKQEMKRYLSEHHLPSDVHAGIDDTSELLFLDSAQRWVRKEKILPDDQDIGRGKGPKEASAELGAIVVGLKIRCAVDQIREKIAKDR